MSPIVPGPLVIRPISDSKKTVLLYTMIVYSDYNESLLVFKVPFPGKAWQDQFANVVCNHVLYVLPSRKLERYLEFS